MKNPITKMTVFGAARAKANASPAAIRKARTEQVAAVVRAADAVLKAGAAKATKPARSDLIAKLDFPPGGLGDLLRARLLCGE